MLQTRFKFEHPPRLFLIAAGPRVAYTSHQRMDAASNHDSPAPARTSAGFEDTRWTAVVDVAGNSDSPLAAIALERLCRSYWLPVYASLRKSGHAPADAEDLCQNFFVHLLQNQRLSRPTREHGKFRSWLLACLKNFLHNEHDRNHAAARRPAGGFVTMEELGGGEAAIGPLNESASEAETFDSVFAHRLVNSVRDALRAEYTGKGRSPLYTALEPFLANVLDGDSTTRIAAQCGMSQGAVRVAHSRVKHRFGELLRQHVHQLVLDPTDVDAEIRHLVRAWASR